MWAFSYRKQAEKETNAIFDVRNKQTIRGYRFHAF